MFYAKAALVALSLVVTPVAASTDATASPKRPEDKARIVYPDKPKKNPTFADYYVPLDNWLRKIGSPLAGHAKELVEESRAGRIDPDFVLAVGYAETNLGANGVRQRGSEYNLWSVASYDSTNTTVHPNNFRNAIRLTVATLNNEYLGGYRYVWQLSGYRNKTGKVYATSPTGNWERNVVATLSRIKGRPIDHNYNFRTR